MKSIQFNNLGIDTLLITNQDNIFYLSNFLLTNFHEREVYIILSNKTNLFITDGRLIEQAKNIIDKNNFTLVERTHTLKLTDIINKFLRDYNYQNLGFEKSNLTIYELEVLKNRLSRIKYIGTHNIVENLRLTKNTQELSLIRTAAQITDKTYKELLSLLKINVQEDYLVWKIKEIFHHYNATPAFEPIIAFGGNSSIPHYTSQATKLKMNDTILIDMGARYKGYCSDMTRVIGYGTPKTELVKMYNTVLKANKNAVLEIDKLLKHSPKVPATNIDKVARDMVVKFGYPPVPHGIGHGVGIAIHEAPHLGPVSPDTVGEGMVFTIEPGIYQPGLGGIRIEDLYAIINGKLEILSKSPKETISL